MSNQPTCSTGYERNLRLYDVEELKTIPGIDALLGKGGFGTIIRGYHDTDGEVAIKLVEPTGSVHGIKQTCKRYRSIK